MKTAVKLIKLRDIFFAMPNQQPVLDRLYQQKPERGGSRIAYRIAALRGTAMRLLANEDAAFVKQRNDMLDEHFDLADEAGNRKPKDGPNSIMAFEKALEPVWDITEEIDVELFPLSAIDSAGYQLSAAEIDALMGLLIQPEPETIEPTLIPEQ